eukprot:CAMPEP_0195298204 /NCGR_PEP_ID=MMETSP0707-20130614/22971_1 /TAXON_ID=33640 /ORGANISM="Asterionellopsis glacialis, Strain CCMP134" /LENGTH=360 /DNA_ID=CAMNT_0040360223 /DNA_START=127 /DNA_END=1209 /DNA_ORIENTATION=+
MSKRNDDISEPQSRGVGHDKKKKALHVDNADVIDITKSTTHVDHDSHPPKNKKPGFSMKAVSGKQIVGMTVLLTILFFIYDATFTPPEKRVLKPDSIDRFLRWVQEHPYNGLGAFLVTIAFCVVLMIPVGTPLTLGCGYVYKGAYGWYVGIPLATIIAMLGSLLGAIACFLLGRYLFRDRVLKWSRKYPLFDAIDIAVSENGFKIMAMLYMTPILPLGPVSYMCGTTAMALSSFAFAKVAATPLMLLYVFIGASCGTLIADASHDTGQSAGAEAASVENNKTMIVLGILVSSITIGLVSRFIKKELYIIFERQKHDKDVSEQDDNATDSDVDGEDSTLEMGMKSRHRVHHRRNAPTPHNA